MGKRVQLRVGRECAFEIWSCSPFCFKSTAPPSGPTSTAQRQQQQHTPQRRMAAPGGALCPPLCETSIIAIAIGFPAHTTTHHARSISAAVANTGGLLFLAKTYCRVCFCFLVYLVIVLASLVLCTVPGVARGSQSLSQASILRSTS